MARSSFVKAQREYLARTARHEREVRRAERREAKQERRSARQEAPGAAATESRAPEPREPIGGP